jgi:hemerythrin-like metal-binding protein
MRGTILMAAIEWQDEYSVGVKELDDQHRQLIYIIDKVIEEQKNKYDADKFSASLALLIHYAYTHFATEERYLLDAKFPELEQHIHEHINFIMKTLGLALKIEEGEDETRKELLKYLKEWFSLHVLGFDRHFIPYLQRKQQN